MNPLASGILRSRESLLAVEKVYCVYRMSNNLGQGNTGGRGFSVRFEICEPVAVNAGVFIVILLLDLYNRQKSLIPVHAIAGVLITLLTLALCRYNYTTAAWIFALLPALFLIVSFLMTVGKNSFFIAAKDKIGSAWDATEDTIGNIYNKSVDKVNSLNASGENIYKHVRDDVSDLWLALYNASVGSGTSPQKAAIQATAQVGAPKTGSPAEAVATAAAMVAAPATATATATVTETIAGEFEYMCIPSPTDAATAAACNACAKEHGTTDKAALDKCIGSQAPAPAVCLGTLATGGVAPSSKKRDECIACTDPKKTTDEQNACRACAMNPEGAACKGPSVMPTSQGFSDYNIMESSPAPF
jgi:hypothetical protein